MARPRAARRALRASVAVALSAAAAAAAGRAEERERPGGRRFAVSPVAGDGRCLFRAAAKGAWLAGVLPETVGKKDLAAGDETAAADALRAAVVTELAKRRSDVEWFLEAPVEEYCAHMAKTHAWGGEPELLMLGHVLEARLVVHMATPGRPGAVHQVAEYGAEYAEASEEAVHLYFHGAGHYELLVATEDGPVESVAWEAR